MCLDRAQRAQAAIPRNCMEPAAPAMVHLSGSCCGCSWSMQRLHVLHLRQGLLWLQVDQAVDGRGEQAR